MPKQPKPNGTLGKKPPAPSVKVRVLPGFRLPRDHSVRFSDSAALVARSFQGFVGDFSPEFFQLRR
jgi:hypothetical protein